MSTVERSIEDMIEDSEDFSKDTEDTGMTVEVSDEPMGQPSIQRPKKKERSEKQIASLQKAREARAKKLAEKKVATKIEAQSTQPKPHLAAPQKKKHCA